MNESKMNFGRPSMNSSLSFDADSAEHRVIVNVGIDLNNEACLADAKGDYKTAVEKYKQAIEIKQQAYGENSVHICTTLRRLCDAYLRLKDVDNAKQNAKKMLSIARAINNGEQIRIAEEILLECQGKN